MTGATGATQRLNGTGSSSETALGGSLVPGVPRGLVIWPTTGPLSGDGGSGMVAGRNLQPDARWMARMIGQFTEDQIIQGLIAAGWDSAEVRLLTEKLVSRRDQMIKDLELADEIPLLRPAGARRKFSYDPNTDGPIVAILADDRKIPAPVSDKKVVAGHLVGQSEGR